MNIFSLFMNLIFKEFKIFNTLYRLFKLKSDICYQKTTFRPKPNMDIGNPTFLHGRLSEHCCVQHEGVVMAPSWSAGILGRCE